MIYWLRTIPANISNIGEAKLYAFDRKPIVLNFVKIDMKVAIPR